VNREQILSNKHGQQTQVTSKTTWQKCVVILNNDVVSSNVWHGESFISEMSWLKMMISNYSKSDKYAVMITSTHNALSYNHPNCISSIKVWWYLGFVIYNLLTFLKLPIVAGKDVNKFPEMDKRSSLTNWPTRNKIHCKLVQKRGTVTSLSNHILLS